MSDRNREREEEEDIFDYSYSIPGSIPGTLNIETDAVPSEIIVIEYNLEAATYVTNVKPEECRTCLKNDSISWIDIRGLGSEGILQKLARIFKLHPLLLEDVVNVPQRPKIEEYEDRLVIITQMVILTEKSENGVSIEQVSLIVGTNYLITLQEDPEDDCFQPVRDRIRHNRGMVRKKGTDYLAYALWDAIIDGYFPVLEAIGDRIEELEAKVVIEPNEKTLGQVYQIRRQLIALRRSIWPQREAVEKLIKNRGSLINEEVIPYLKDCYDHTIQIIDAIETYRELTSNLMNVYMSAVSNKINEIMKTIAVVSTIFIPLTFITSLYGMNFNTEISPYNMPELNLSWGYPAFWLLTITVALSLIFFFWRRGWFNDIS
ncbi:MAG: magnesium/cobalt transporter CorA [Prochloraceae cyanobacterium]